MDTTSKYFHKKEKLLLVNIHQSSMLAIAMIIVGKNHYNCDMIVFILIWPKRMLIILVTHLCFVYK